MKLGLSSKDSLLFGMILLSDLILGCAGQEKDLQWKMQQSRKHHPISQPCK